MFLSLCQAVGIIVKGAFNQRHGISTMARNSPEDYCIYLICDESIECGENITIGRLYTNVESFLKNWERVSNV